MHSVLDFAEIRHRISGFCDDPSLAALSSTATLWAPLALDTLYGQPLPISYALYSLLFMMPPKEDVEECALVFPATNPTLNSTAIERFSRLYASRVRSIIYSPPDRPYQDGEAEWIAALGRQLPTIEIEGSDDSLDPPCASTILVITRVLGPTVRHLKASHGSSLMWLPKLQSSLTLLASLEFYASTPAAHDAWSRIIATLPSLDSVSVFDLPLDESVTLEGSVVNSLQRLPHIKPFSIRTSSETVGYIPGLFRVLGSPHTLTKLWLHESSGAPRTALCLQDFEPLLQLIHLKEVFFHFPTEIDLRDADIEVMVLSWPQLVSFRLVGLQFTSIKLLLSLAQHSALREVEIYIDLAVELTGVVAPTTPSTLASSSTVNALTMVQPNFDGVTFASLALFISTVAPGIRCIFSKDYRYFKSETMEGDTQRLNSILATISDNRHR
ncbi:hypothetical protein DL96DRAFT_1717879 [Flagelloscypha sp. PMI_526]|nr:hypothetical protein DL96DRAFT_1717879 [Flagelloscypha sp. PMI_526]